MAPKTRTGRKRDRRKIGKYVQERQLQRDDDLVGPAAVTKDTTVSTAAEIMKNEDATDTSVSAAYTGTDGKEHPPDCPCILRKLGKDLFLPPSMRMNDGFTEGNDNT